MAFLVIGSTADLLKSLLALLLGGGFLLAALVYVAKVAVDKFFEAAAKKYEAEITLAHDTEMERLRSALRLSEGNVSRLHARHLIVIDEVYVKIVEAQSAAEAWVTPLKWGGAPPASELQKDAIDKFNELVKAAELRRIWLMPTVCDRLSDFTTRVKQSLIEFQHKDEQDPKERTKAWGDAWDGLRRDARSIQNTLENDFRSILNGQM